MSKPPKPKPANDTSWLHRFSITCDVYSDEPEPAKIKAVDIRSALLHCIVTLSDEDLLKVAVLISSELR
jgi:hypothetical protein